MATREQTVGRALEIAGLWDAGESGCGALIMGLKRELHRIEPGELLQVTARNAGADLPAWCRLTGHMLIAAEHPTYVLRKRDD